MGTGHETPGRKPLAGQLKTARATILIFTLASISLSLPALAEAPKPAEKKAAPAVQPAQAPQANKPAQQPQPKTAPPKQKGLQIAFFQLEVAGVEQKVSTIVSDAILAELSKFPDIKVIGSKEIDAMLSFEQKKQMTGCTDTSCMVALGGALGVDKILSGNIGKLGESHTFNMKLIDIRAAAMERLFNKRLKGSNEEAFLDLVPEAIATLFPDHTAQLSQGGTVPSVEAMAKQGTPVSSYMPWVLIGTGGAALITGGVVHGLASSAYSDYKSLPESDPTLKDKWSSVNTKANVAYALYGVGFLAAGGGLAWYFLAEPRTEKMTSLNFIPLAGETIGGAVAGSW